MIGQTISHYRIIEKLGEGGMGVVYKAHDTKLNRDVALKFLPHGLSAHEPERARFLQEAQAAAALNHPNICTIYDISQEAGEQFIVMEYVDGVTLREKIAAGRMQIADSVTLGIQIGEALQEAHSKGIVHRDIKAENIMVNSKNQVKVMDFGLAKLKGSLKLTKTSSTVGTLAYMAPEQIQGGEVDARSDIFSFGVVLYEMLTGHMPFRGEHEAAMMYSILNEEPEPLQKHLADAPAELLHVLNRALEKDPGERYQKVSDMVIDLRRLNKETSRILRSTSTGFGAPANSSRALSTDVLKKKWTRPASIIAAALVVVVIGYFLIWPMIDNLFFRPERTPIAVITFENQTEDPQYDNLRVSIPNLLITQLGQSSALQVTSWERMRDLLKQLGRGDARVIDADLGFELCRLDSVKVLVTGSFVKMGDIFATDVKVLDVESKKLLASAGAQGKGVGSILEVQVKELGTKVATTAFGLSASKVAQEQRPVTEVTTTSFEAYNAYLAGMQELDKFNLPNARRFFEKAIALDSTFALAYLYLAKSCSNLGDTRSERSAVEKAFKYSDRVAIKDRLSIEAVYAKVCEGALEKHNRILKQIASEFPKDKRVYWDLYLSWQHTRDEGIALLQRVIALDPQFGPAINQLGYEYSFNGDYENALKWFKRYASIYPGVANPYDSMGEVYFFMGNLNEAIAKYKEALEIDPDWGSYDHIAYLYALTENYGSAIEWLNKTHGANRSMMNDMRVRVFACFFDYWLGRNSDASVKIEEAQGQFKKTGNLAGVAYVNGVRSAVLADRGKFEEARRMLLESAKPWNSIVPAYASFIERIFELSRAELYLRQKQTELSQKLLADTTFPLQKVPVAVRLWLPFQFHQLRAELFLAQDRFDQAIELFKSAPTLPIPVFSSPEIMMTYNLTLVRDGLARAFARKGDVEAAIGEYERITRFDPASKDRRLIHPLHHYELAKLYEMKGMKDKAIAQYEKFLSLWKYADAEHPEPKDARTRLARLKAPGKK